MVFLRQWLLILAALVLSGGPMVAAGTKEDRAYSAAIAAFQDEGWSRAENAFAQFVQKYPDSTNVNQAILLQAQAQFKQSKLPQAAALLETRKAVAGTLADQYNYWIGEAQFAAGDFSTAVRTFDSLDKTFPESPLKLRAAVESASARVRLADWPGVETFLEDTNGIFQRALRLDPDGDLVSRGRLLLAQAKFAQTNYHGATTILDAMNPQTLTPELDWQRFYLINRIKLQANDLEGALAASTNLTRVSGTGHDLELRSEGAIIRGETLEKSGRPEDAIAAYRENLAADVPAEKQQQAILKISALASAQTNFPDAEDALQNFVSRFPGSAAAEIALLSLGELHLKDYAQTGQTNHLALASAVLDQFLHVYPDSALLGKARLDRGWCEWLAGNFSGSLDDFRTAAEKLPPSEDLAVARFKTGDALFHQKNFSGALTNYHSVLNDFQDVPGVTQRLGARALYQSLRANLELHDLTGASDTLVQILNNYPDSDFADSGTLLLGENLSTSQQPAEARKLFIKFEQQFTNSTLRPQIELAIAQTYEQEGDWTNAIAEYNNWVRAFPTSDLQARANYALAQANFHAGDEAGAFSLFTNFVARFPTDNLAPLAQWWIADHFFNTPDFVNAERNYKMIFQNPNWQNSPLFWPAQMMAGRAAVGRLGYPDAIGYFSTVVGETNCPPEVGAQARLEWGRALMLSDPGDTNNPLANFQTATNMFAQVVQLWPTNEFGLEAWGAIGKCDLQLSNYDEATNAYAQIFNSPVANVSARSQAQIGFGIVLEKKAALATGITQNEYYQAALDNYLAVFYETNLRESERADSFWLKKAGLQALDVMETLQQWPQADKFFLRLEQTLPQLKDFLEKKKTTLPGKS
jgi:TolA-binding protein